MNKEEIIRKAEEYIAGARYVDGMYVDCVEVSFFEGVLELIKNYEEEKNALIAGQETLQKFVIDEKNSGWNSGINCLADKLIKIGKEDGAYDYVDLWTIDRERNALMIEEDSHRKFVEQVNKNAALIEKAKEIINDYCVREFNEEADFTDITKIGIAYTTTEDEKHEIQVNVNLVKRHIETLVDDKTIRIEQYANLEDLVYNGLDGMKFDDLVSLDEEELNLVEKG